ncbi:MAG: HlyC/CorC family transporter [Acetobacteraceae bacterium]|nr:HlyC/CorC family transporter [Acetobacteraceae bacterium]
MGALGGLLLLAALIAVSVVISMSEISFAAAREIRIRIQAEKGDARAVRFLALRRDSSRVITALQICLNGVAVLGGIVGEALLGPAIGASLARAGVGDFANGAGSAISFALVTGLFVLFADLLPKRIAMQAPERVALLVAWFPLLAVTVFRPLVWLFIRVSDALLRLLRLPAVSPSEVVTAEELRATLEAGAASGALLAQEHRLIENVLALESRSVTSVMTPRDEIIFLDLNDSAESQRDKVRRHPFSRYPLCEGGLDAVVGCVRAEDVLAGVVEGGTASLDLKRARRDALSIPETLNVWEVLSQFQAQGTGFALVVSEYALVVGIVTFKDVMGALMGGLASPFEEELIVQRDEHSWLVDGIAPLPDVVRALGIEGLPNSSLYETVGGFVMHRLRRVARRADKVEAAGFTFEVVDVEHLRVNQLLITRIGGAATAERSERPGAA